MPRYSAERKAALLKKLLPPVNMSVAALARQEYARLPPSQIVPRLADQQRYLASESTLYRMLQAADQQHRRGRRQPPRKIATPKTHVAKAANQVWSWCVVSIST